jgi:hypothetical protein
MECISENAELKWAAKFMSKIMPRWSEIAGLLMGIVEMLSAAIPKVST